LGSGTAEPVDQHGSVAALQHRRQPPSASTQLCGNAGRPTGPTSRAATAALAAWRRHQHLRLLQRPGTGDRLRALHVFGTRPGTLRRVVPELLPDQPTAARRIEPLGRSSRGGGMMETSVEGLAEELAEELAFDPSVTQELPAGEKRRDPALRLKIEEAILLQQSGWLLGRPGGTPWSLSRTKRWIEALCATLALLLLSPLLLVVAISIKISSQGPVFFIQQRTGYRGRRFGMFKFRTMVVNAEELKESLRHLNKHGSDSVDFKIDRDPRITGIGRHLRRSSLDELPNLINVVLGHMRLVGPRPTSFKATTYHDHHLGRLSIYPGITGLWQVSGRSDVGFDERVELDMKYIAQQGPLMDLKILLITPFKVLNGQGAS